MKLATPLAISYSLLAAILQASAAENNFFDPYYNHHYYTKSTFFEDSYRQHVADRLREELRAGCGTGSDDSCVYLRIAKTGRVLDAEFYDAKQRQMIRGSTSEPVARILATAKKCKFDRMKHSTTARWFCFDMAQLSSNDSPITR